MGSIVVQSHRETGAFEQAICRSMPSKSAITASATELSSAVQARAPGRATRGRDID
jgi:hypothetical protein